jgi:hypothetical protein
MTLNQIVNRIRLIVLAHKQIRSLKIGGSAEEFFADKTTNYIACCIQYNSGFVNTGQIGISFRAFVVDLVHNVEDRLGNEQDVLSDTLLVVQDLISILKNPEYDDWRVTVTSNFDAVINVGRDNYSGWSIDFDVAAIFTENICQIPMAKIESTPTEDMNKIIEDMVYKSSGSEGFDVAIAGLKNKKILQIIREGVAIYKVSNNPNSTEYTWDNETIKLGTPITNSEERFLILYRNY